MRSGGQFIEHQHHPVGQHRRERLHAVDGSAIRDLVEDIEDLGMLCGKRPGPDPDLGREQQLPAWRREQPVTAAVAVAGIGQRPLISHGKRPDVLDLVAEEFNPQRMFLRGREDVEDAATDRDLAAPFHQVDPVVGDSDQLFHHVVEIGTVTDLQ